MQKALEQHACAFRALKSNTCCAKVSGLTSKKIYCSVHLKNGEKLCILVCFSFSFFLLFVFQAESGNTNNHRNVLSDVLYECPFSRDSSDIKKFPTKLPSVEKNQLEFFCCNFELIKWVSFQVYNSLFMLNESRKP